MRSVDVNVCVYAHRRESDRHVDYRRWLDDARRGPEPLGLFPVVLSGFLRVVTHPKVFLDPTPLDQAWAFVHALVAAPAVHVVGPGQRHLGLFEEACRTGGASGNLVPDAFLASLAMENNATWYSADRGFARYPGLRWRHPLDG